MIDFKCIDIRTAIRLVAWLIGHIGTVAVALGLAWKEPSEIFYTVLGIVLYCTIVTIRAIYKNNPTSEFGILCQRLKEKAEAVGVGTVLESLLQDFPSAEDFDGEEDGDEELKEEGDDNGTEL